MPAQRMPPSVAPAVLTAVAFLAGCMAAAGAPDVEVRVTVEDGVTIVENPGLHIADSTAWRIDTTDVVRIGIVDRPEEYMIGRLAGMLRLADGTILVADAIAHEIRESALLYRIAKH